MWSRTLRPLTTTPIFLRPIPSRSFAAALRTYSTPAALSPPSDLDAKERAVFERLVAGLAPAELEVRDVSGGCGSMYAIEVASERFRGLGVLAQQRMVNKVLEGEIGGWHGLQVKTRVP